MRVVAALIVIGVVAFLAFDAYVIYRVFKGRAAADDYGSFAIPGETEITVPAGRVKISYQEAYKAAGGGDGPIDFYVPAALQVEVKGPAGEPLEIKGPGFGGLGSSVDTGSSWSRALVGTVQITEPGTYTITAGPAIEGGVEPQILIGR